MNGGSRKSPRATSIPLSPHKQQQQQQHNTYPIPAYLNFVPGGIEYGSSNTNTNSNSNSNNDVNTKSEPTAVPLSPLPSSSSKRNWYALNQTAPGTLVAKAHAADRILRKYSLRFAHANANSPKDGNHENSANNKNNNNIHININDPEESQTRTGAGAGTETGSSTDKSAKVPHRLPSLSILAEAAFGPLTGVYGTSVRRWADEMVLAYLDDKDDVDGDELEKALAAGENDLIDEFHRLQAHAHAHANALNNPKSNSNSYFNHLSPFSSSMKMPSNGNGSPKHNRPNHNNNNNNHDLITILKTMHQKQLDDNNANPNQNPLFSQCLPVRPCGYVFKKNDIAWNCRTCQTDYTCVLCDTCFHASDHEGHDVYFHRTSPGGCCDCGDPEAWKVEGCCAKHRPRVESQSPSSSSPADVAGKNGDITMNGLEGSGEDVEMTDMSNSSSLLQSVLSEEKIDFEAVKASLRGRADGNLCVAEMLPPRFAAALGVVIGAAVQTTIRAIDGAAIGADPVQWTRRWADQVRRIHDGCAVDEEYVLSSHSNKMPCSNSVGDSMDLDFPNRFKLHLRLHNDDVHTYDEVIDSLYQQRHRMFDNHSNPKNDGNAETDTAYGIVSTNDQAKDLTSHVDTDGQVIVRGYNTFEGAKAGFKRLKKYGLHCAVVSVPQTDLEIRARILLSWLSDISAAHPAVAALVVHALVDVTEGSDPLGGAYIWANARMMPPWSFSHGYFSSVRVVINEEGKEEGPSVPNWRKRMDVFPPDQKSSFLTREEARQLYKLGLAVVNDISSPKKGVDLNFYSNIPYSLISERYRKSPHSLWGIMPSPFTSPKKLSHPFLCRDSSCGNQSYYLSDSLIVLETDLRKQQEPDTLIHDEYTHDLLGLHMISGVGLVDVDGDEHGGSAMKPTAEDWHQLLSISSYRAPVSPILLMLLLDPYPPKQLRASIHPLFLSLLVDSRMKSRFAASLGGIAYRSLTTLYCSGVGTETDSPLSFTVQIFTAGSLVRALCNTDATKKLLSFDGDVNSPGCDGFDDAFSIPVAQNIVRCIHTNLLGSCKEVKMVLKNTVEKRNSNEGPVDLRQRNKHLSALTYQKGESPHTTLLPAAPDDAFLDARSTKHKRLPPLIRDLEYIFETPGTALRLLLPSDNEVYRSQENGSSGLIELPHFPRMWCRLLRLAQGVDPQKRKISGGHVEYEQIRWLEAYSLSIHFAGACSKLAESLSKSVPNTMPPAQESLREGMGNMFVAILREIKLWLYKEQILDSGLPQTTADSQLDVQRSTLHVSMSTLGVAAASADDVGKPTALNCQFNTKMTEVHLEMIENAIRIEQSQYQLNGAGRGTIMGDWLRVPHSPHAGATLSFHIPLHRAFARNIRSLCSFVVPEDVRQSNPLWWLLPTIDSNQTAAGNISLEHPLSSLLRPSLRSSNCRVTWAAGPECNTEEAQRRRSRARAVSAAITASKITHSLCDHPLRCLAAAEQILRHLWLKNGSSGGAMANNYSDPPLCQSFRDLDFTLVQLSASGMSIGLGARRVFSLLLSRFDLDGFLCDLEKRGGGRSPTNSAYSSQWIMPPILQEPDHAPSLVEALFTTICILVTELPPPPPSSNSDDSYMRMHVRRGLLHALAVKQLSYSKAMEAATNAITKKDIVASSFDPDEGGSSFRTVFGEVLREISSQKTQGSRMKATPCFELNCDVSDEYDPSFFHLRIADHQQAMDNIARLRKQKFTVKGKRNSGKCLPIVGPPPTAHPRFVPCRMLLHIPALDAAIRRALILALTGGDWLPPQKPMTLDDDIALGNPSFSSELSASDGKILKTPSKKLKNDKDKPKFTAEVVDNSSVSFFEVLQLLTLQIHTLEECASLHTSHPNLDHETKSASASITINSYLGRIVHVPPSLIDEWAFRCSPDGPLDSSGSGLNRASVLGLLIALYEHKSDNAALNSDDSGHGEEGLGGARFLVCSGLKWLLRFVSALVHGATSVREACQSALEGIPIQEGSSHPNSDTTWTIDSHLQSTVAGMLENLPDLWPSKDSNVTDYQEVVSHDKNREAMKAAQMRVIERMKKQQASFVASMSQDEKVGISTKNSNEESNLCIICRCDDCDGENNGPMGFLGHVQRSRTIQLRSNVQSLESSNDVALTYRVVGDMGCQIRASKSMDSAPIKCIPVGSLVTVVKAKVAPKYGLKSRRVLVRYSSPAEKKVYEGWASVQSAQGYTILSPLIDICYTNSRWGSTRPIIRQCGHAAHLGCVDAHVASIHQKAQSDTPFDGRFAAEIDDGEFLCPLCKQLSNIVVPAEETNKKEKMTKVYENELDDNMATRFNALNDSLVKYPNGIVIDEKKRSAVKQYGTYLYQAMQVSSWNRKKMHLRRQWHRAIESWDFKEEGRNESSDFTDESIDDILPLLRQQHIAWSSAGHGAAAAEASTRGIRKTGFEPPTSDPWVDFNSDTRDTHPLLLELRRTLIAASSLYEIVSVEIFEKTASQSEDTTDMSPVIGYLLADILNGKFWTSSGEENVNKWETLTSLLTCIPCHVSKDETLNSRHEARATAAQIWAVKGGQTLTAYKAMSNGSRSPEQNGGHMYPPISPNTKRTKFPAPSTPMCLRNIPGHEEKLEQSFGTMDPQKVVADSSNIFRPAFAAGFLYMPLLSWDLNTFAGALYSTLLTADEFRAENLCDASRVLLVARMIQVLITPYGFDKVEEACNFECDIDVNKESEAIVSLLTHCKTLANPNGTTRRKQDNENTLNVLSSISLAILPFARSLVLLLRAAFSAARIKGYEMDAKIENFVEDEDTMYIEDGFYFMQKLGCPLPSEINNYFSANNGSKNGFEFWGDLASKWIGAVASFDAYHGSVGNHLEYSHEGKKWIQVSSSFNSNKKLKSEKMSVEEKAMTDRSSDDVMKEESSTDGQNESLESNEDDTMHDYSADDNQDARFDLEQIDSALDLGGDFEDDEDIDEDIDDGTDVFGLPSLPSQPSQDTSIVNRIDEESVYSTSDVNGDIPDDDDLYANVSSGAIIPYQSSFLGSKKPGPGPRGSSIDFTIASSIMSDLSHLGSIHSTGVESSGLIQLPKSYVELYTLVNKVKATVKNTALDDNEDIGNGETAICLLTGSILRAGLPRRHSRRMHRPPGSCTLHARSVASGSGIFFLLQKCIVLLVHNKKSAYSASLYVDEHGEEDTGLARGRPLFLNDERYEALEALWRSHGIPREVAQIRSTSDRVIRDNWY